MSRCHTLAPALAVLCVAAVAGRAAKLPAHALAQRIPSAKRRQI